MPGKRSRRGGQRRQQEAQRRLLLDGLRALVSHGQGLPYPLGERMLHGLGAEIGLTPEETVTLFKRLIADGDVHVVPQRGGRRYIDGIGAAVMDIG
jgi:hypothetical protein